MFPHFFNSPPVGFGRLFVHNQNAIFDLFRDANS